MLIIMIFNATMLLAVARAEEDVWADPFAVALFLPVIIMAGFILICTGIAHLTKNMKWLNSRRDQYIAKVAFCEIFLIPIKECSGRSFTKNHAYCIFFCCFHIDFIDCIFYPYSSTVDAFAISSIGLGDQTRFYTICMSGNIRKIIISLVVCTLPSSFSAMFAPLWQCGWT